MPAPLYSGAAWYRLVPMSLLFVLAAVAGWSGSHAAQIQTAPLGDEILVTGDRPRSDPRGKIEEPYPEVERVPLGSRIPRQVARRPFRSVATESGLAGIVGHSGDGNWDGTGGSGHGVRTRLVIECTAGHAQVSEEVACILFRVGEATEAGNHAAAAEALAPLLERRHLTDWERYYVGHFAYALALDMDDAEGRERALGIMLASGRMEPEEQVSAMRTLVAMALRTGDDQAAISRLTQLTARDADPFHFANLAGLLARNGQLFEARRYMSEAVALQRARGEAPPAAWTDFLAAAQ